MSRRHPKRKMSSGRFAMVPPVVVRYHSPACVRVAIVRAGRALLHLVQLDASPLRVRRVPASERHFMQPLERQGGAYPVARAVQHFRRHARTYGTTKAAAQFLARVEHQGGAR